jgi:hypothetical protein
VAALKMIIDVSDKHGLASIPNRCDLAGGKLSVPLHGSCIGAAPEVIKGSGQRE